MTSDDQPIPSRVLDLCVDALASYRLTRLVTADVISESLRQTLVGRQLGWSAEELAEPPSTAVEAVDSHDDPPKLARLITCRWCTGVWIAGAVVGARTIAPRAWDPLARALALSASAVLLARLETE